MPLTYNSFPSLLFTSYNKDNAPEELPIIAGSNAARDYLASNKGIRELMPTMAIFNSLGQSRSNYWLNDRQFQAVEHDPKFRAKHFTEFIQRPHGLKYGVITFKQGGQYLYLIMDPAMSAKAKGLPGGYFAAAMIIKDMFVGFEEGILLPGRINVIPGGWYESGMDVAGYLSFVSIALNFLEGASMPAPDNRTTEIILAKK